MRVIAGRWRGCRLDAPQGADVRPTTDRVRESLFAVLEGGRLPLRLAGARVLDAFAGTGALGLEALSRGAGHATFLDRDDRALACVRANAARCRGAGAHIDIRRGDATRPPTPTAACGLLFLDPPYASGLAAPALAALDAAGWADPAALAVIEAPVGATVDLPAGWQILDDRRHGRTRLAIAGRPQ